MRFALGIMVLSVTACGVDDGKNIVPITETGTYTTDFVLPPELYVTDDIIYSYDATWGFANIAVRSQFELVFLWDSLTMDAWDVEQAADSYAKLVLFELSTTEFDVEGRLGIDDLEPVITNRWELDVAGRTGANLSELLMGTTPLDPATTLVPDPSRTWLLVLANQQGERLDIRTGLVLVPDDQQPGTVVTFPTGGASYEWTGKIDGQDEFDTSANHPVYTLDWSALTVDAYGKAFDPARGDVLFVAKFDSVDEGDDLSDEVLDLQSTAVGWWTLDPAGATSVTLEGATDSSGAAFAGFEEGVVWLVGQSCTGCMGPAPLWITSIRVR